MTYCPGYTPDKDQKHCVYSFSHDTGLNVVLICETMQEAELKAKEMNDNKGQLKLF